MRFKSSWFLAVFLGAWACVPIRPAAAVSPFYAKYYLVAGAGEAGFRDGEFLSAAFRQPQGLALSADGAWLYVADTANHALRAVDLRHQHRVTTLCGNGQAGAVDGRGSAARLSAPAQVVAAPDGKSLYFLDQAGTQVRRLDLASRAVTTLVRDPPMGTRITSLVLDPDRQRLLLLSRLTLWQADLATGRLARVGSNAELGCPDGRLLWLDQALVYCAPCDPGRIYRLPPASLAEAEAVSPTAAEDVAFGPHLDLQPAAGLVLTPTASGFCGLPQPGNHTLVLYWDPAIAGFMRADPVSGQAYPSDMSDYQGTLLPGPSSDVVGINATSDRRYLLKGQVALASGPSGQWYAAEAAGNRVVGVDSNLLLPVGADINLIRRDEPKPAGATRLLVIGDSLSFYWREYSAEKRYNVHLSFIRQLETQLNLESALKGSGARYEVLSRSTQLGLMNGGTATFFVKLGDEALEGHGIDQVLLMVDYMNLEYEIFTFARNRTEDDLAIPPLEADWPGLSGKERYAQLGPETRGLLDWVRTHPQECAGYLELDERGNLRALVRDRQLLELPRVRQFAVAVMRKALLRAKALARKHGASLGIVLMPSRDLVEIGEQGGDDFYDHINPASLDQPLADMAADIGVPCYTLTQDVRLVALPFYPLVMPFDHHFNFRAQGWMAALLARRMLAP